MPTVSPKRLVEATRGNAGVPLSFYDRDNTVKDMKPLALELLLSGHSAREVARELGVDRTTVWRWMRTEELSGPLLEARRARAAAARAIVDEMTFDALGVLHEVMLDEQQSGSARVAAAREVLERSSAVPNKKASLRHEGTVEAEIDRVIDRLEDKLDAATYERVLRVIVERIGNLTGCVQ